MTEKLETNGRTSVLPNISKNAINASDYEVDPNGNTVIKRLPSLNTNKHFAEDQIQNKPIIT